MNESTKRVHTEPVPPNMAAKPTLAEVAARAGVSVPTASKVVNGRADVSPTTRATVVEALEELGYRSPLQRKNRATQSTVVEVHFDALGSTYSLEILHGIMAAAASLGAEIILSVAPADLALAISPERRAQRMADEGRGGLIAVTSTFDAAQLSAFRRKRIPVVAIDPLNPPPADVVSIGATNWAGGKAATEHLVALGHRRIAHLGGPEAVECSQARLHGYLAAMRSHGLPVTAAEVLMGEFGQDWGVEGLRRLLRLPAPPTAIFAGNDSIALGVLAESRRMGITVPESLSVVGFDGVPQDVDSAPALTTVAQPLRDMGSAALRALLRQFHGEVLDSRRVELATRLVVRGSTAAPAR
ncbi:LacI family DNA-binding transcriptional regulator [Pseudarthrobacter sp. PS3-L1]|uniref:LacI family DNA-binding transcriptional regulator n=1 Tax=Pseudarthrobacter sp. PS3-L1 TaxID=3046207 RepID=UPI0032D8C541